MSSLIVRTRHKKLKIFFEESYEAVRVKEQSFTLPPWFETSERIARGILQYERSCHDTHPFSDFCPFFLVEGAIENSLKVN